MNSRNKILLSLQALSEQTGFLLSSLLGNRWPQWSYLTLQGEALKSSPNELLCRLHLTGQCSHRHSQMCNQFHLQGSLTGNTFNLVMAALKMITPVAFIVSTLCKTLHNRPNYSWLAGAADISTYQSWFVWFFFSKASVLVMQSMIKWH